MADPFHDCSLFLQLRCCGVYNYTSWFGSVYYPSNGIPASCCFNSSDCNTEDLRNTTVAPSKVYHQVGVSRPHSSLQIIPVLLYTASNALPGIQSCH